MMWSPGFRMLWLAGTTSALGNGLRWVALPLLAVRQSTDPWTISLITAAEQAPWLLVGLLAGALADRYDRRRLAGWSDLSRAVLMAAFTVAVAMDATPILALALLCFLLTCGEALASAAVSALIPTLVPPPARPSANGRLQAGVQVADSLIGTPAGAVLFGVLAVAPFALDAVTFAASAVCIMLLRLPGTPTAATATPTGFVAAAAALPAGTAAHAATATAAPPAGAMPPGLAGRADRDGLLHEVAAGVRFLWRHPMLRALCLLQAVANTAFTGVLAILVLFATTTLGLSSAGFGLLVAVFAVGGTAGGLSTGWLAARLNVRTCLLWSIVASAVATAAVGLSGTAPQAAAVALLLGFTWTVAGAFSASLRQEAVPDAFMGRVTSAFRLMSFAAGLGGALAAGALAHGYGLRAPFVAGGALLVLGALATAPRIRSRTS